MIDWAIEALCPWVLIRRIERQLDAKERIAVSKMKVEWWRNERKRLLENFYRPVLHGVARCISS